MGDDDDDFGGLEILRLEYRLRYFPFLPAEIKPNVTYSFLLSAELSSRAADERRKWIIARSPAQSRFTGTTAKKGARVYLQADRFRDARDNNGFVAWKGEREGKKRGNF